MAYLPAVEVYPVKESKEKPGDAQLVTRTGILLSLALVLHVVEGLLPPPGIPGAKLGLANIVTLLALNMWGWRQAAFLVVLRQVAGGALAGTLFSAGFMFGLAGGLASLAVMQALMSLASGRTSLMGVSMAGAVSHNWAQWLVARFLVGHPALAWYLPVLLLAALPCGALVALAARPVIRSFGKPEVMPRWINPGEIALVGCLVLLSIILPVRWAGAGGDPGFATVTVGGQVVEFLDLNSPGTREITAGGYRWIIKVEQGGVRVLEGNCPDQVCVHTGVVNHQGQVIICAPGKMVIQMEGTARGDQVDAVLP